MQEYGKVGLSYEEEGRPVVLEEKGNLIHFISYNIWNGCNSGLESALRRMVQTNIDLGVFQDTKFNISA